jgi:hypothetical protein
MPSYPADPFLNVSIRLIVLYVKEKNMNRSIPVHRMRKIVPLVGCYGETGTGRVLPKSRAENPVI